MAENISGDQLKQGSDQYVIIDVREPDEMSNGFIENSQNMPLGLLIRNAKKGQIEELREKKICVYCASGYRGNIAADELVKAGFSAVNLEGGMLFGLDNLSYNTLRKARKLVESNSVVKIKEDLYQVKSSTDHTKSYFVTLDSCECQGFKNFYKFHHGKGLKANCSHLEAIRIFQKENQ